jgi:hypothetical protein
VEQLTSADVALDMARGMSIPMPAAPDMRQDLDGSGGFGATFPVNGAGTILPTGLPATSRGMGALPDLSFPSS